MRDVIAEISNVRRLRHAAATLLHVTRGMPAIGLVSGDVGLGKTTATRNVCAREAAVWVGAVPDWTPRWMTADIAEELGCVRGATTERNYRNIIGALRQQKRAIFIDEADHLCRKLHLVETLRAIHDQCGAPIVLIGMAALPAAIKALPQLHSRIAHWVEFQPCDLKDVRLMAEQLCEVLLDDELISHLANATGGSVRAVRVALERVEGFARRKGKKTLGLDDLPDEFELVYTPEKLRKLAASERAADPVKPQATEVRHVAAA
jgi:DNA transposition AAA+ family ATPase